MAESTSKEKAIIKKEKKLDEKWEKGKRLRRLLIQATALTPKFPVAEQDLIRKINENLNMAPSAIVAIARKLLGNLRTQAPGDNKEKWNRKINSLKQVIVAGGSSPDSGSPHKARGGAIKKYSHGGGVSSGHQLTYKRK